VLSGKGTQRTAAYQVRCEGAVLEGWDGSRHNPLTITIKDGRIIMPIHQRSDVVDGLRTLADFLEDYEGPVKLHRASRTDVQFCILAKDPEVAREEFDELTELMYEVAPDVSANYVSNCKHYATAAHHTASLEFGNGAVAYQVLWIEKTGEGEEQ
jgi:glycerol-3-phosphate cytidylyltransferase-like family protein